MKAVEFIQNFVARKGLNVLLSVVLAKAINFIVSILVIRILEKSEYGLIAFGLTVLSFFAPFAGAGLYQGLLRFGALSKSQLAKKVLFQKTLKTGLKYSALLTALFILCSPIIALKLPEALPYMLLLSFQLISLFLFLMIQVYCRLIHRNQIFANIDIQYHVLLLIFNVGMCYLLGGFGYVLSMILVPLFLSLYYLKKLNLRPSGLSKQLIQQVEANFEFEFKELFSYGMYTSVGGVLSQLLFAIDILLIGNLLSDPEQLAQYKASSIIPFSLIALSVAVLTTDFVKLAGKAVEHKKAIAQYYLNYLKIFGLLSVGIILFFHFFSEPLMRLFGTQYQGHSRLLIIFSYGVVGALLLRTPLGNLLSAIGWPKVNALFSIIVLIVNLVANYFMILRYGIEGAAITTSALMWLSGLLSLGAFIYFLKKE